MSDHRWIKFWPSDYEGDAALRMCSLAAQGLWMRLLCHMHSGTPYGHLTIKGKPLTPRQIAMIVSAPEREVTKLMRELEEASVFSRNAEGIAFSRRMVRDKAYANQASEYGRSGGNPALKPTENPSDKGRDNGGGKPLPLTPSLSGGDKVLEAEAESESESKQLASDGVVNLREAAADDRTGDRLEVEGTEIWERLTGDRTPLAESFLRDILKGAPPGSAPRLMALLREAEAAPPADARTTLCGWLEKRLLPPPPDCQALRNRLPADKMPRLGDPPNLWAALAQDGRYELDQHGTSRPVFAGYYVDQVIREMCEAANINDPLYRGDWDVAVAWLRDGFEPHQIVPIIRAVVARAPDRRISKLKYFDAAVREQRSGS